jgi:S1-C subfamily serine protease
MHARFVVTVIGMGMVALLPACHGAPGAPPDGTAAPPVLTAPPHPLVAPLSPGAHIEDERNTIAVFKAVAPSTVFVTQNRVVYDMFAGSAEEVAAGSGSGFVWDTQGHIVTNFHVVKDASSLTVTFENQKTFPARVVGVEPLKDIAVIQVKAPAALLVPVHVAKESLEVGQKAVAIGNPFGLDHTLTTGVISALGRQVHGIGGVTIRSMIQTDTAINPGNSGGPLLDSAGELIGMNTMIYSKSGAYAGIGFAVPASTIARVVPQIIKYGRATEMSLGVGVDPQGRIENRFGIRGVVVISVPPGSAAARAGVHGLEQTPDGLALGDVIVGIGSTKIADYDDLYNALDEHKAGDVVDVKLARNGKVVTMKLDVVASQ